MATNKTVFFLIGILLIVLGTSMLAPYSIQVIYGENSHSFISSSFVTIFIGILFVLANLEKEFKLNLRQIVLDMSEGFIRNPSVSNLIIQRVCSGPIQTLANERADYKPISNSK